MSSDLAYGQTDYSQTADSEPLGGYSNPWSQGSDYGTDTTTPDVSPTPEPEAAEPPVVLSADGPEDEEDTDSPEEDSDSTTSKGRSAAKKAANRSLIRRVSAKTVELAAAPEGRRKALAALLGSKDDVVALTTAVMTAERAALSPLTSLTAVLDADGEVEQAITVMGLALEGKLKDVWAVLTSFGVVDGVLPNNDTKATRYVVDQLPTIDFDSLRADVAAVNDLAKRW